MCSSEGKQALEEAMETMCFSSECHALGGIYGDSARTAYDISTEK